MANRLIASSVAFLLALTLPLGSFAYASEAQKTPEAGELRYLLDENGEVVIDPETGEPVLVDQNGDIVPGGSGSPACPGTSEGTGSAEDVPDGQGAGAADDSVQPAPGGPQTDPDAPEDGSEADGDDQTAEDGSGDPVIDPDDPADDTGKDPEGPSDADEGAASQPQPAPGLDGNSSEPGDAQAAGPAYPAPCAPNAGAASGLPLVHRAYAEDMDTEKFIALIGEQARIVGQEYGLYASVMVAQAVLESGSGMSLLAQAPNNNLFGIKGEWIDGRGEAHSVDMPTSEDDGTGACYTVIASFRAYESVSDSMTDYAELLRHGMGGFYKGAWRENAATYEDAALFLQGRYATDTSYASKLVSLIDTYDLTRFDVPLDWQANGLMTQEERDAQLGVEPLDDEQLLVAEEHAPKPLFTSQDGALDIGDLLAEATSYLGTPYVWGGTEPGAGLDCSGLVQSAYKQALGIDLPRTTYAQQHSGQRVSLDDARPGDLLFFDRGGDVGHVALYLGDGFYIHAPRTGEEVKVASVEEYAPSFAVRVLDTHERTSEEMDVLADPWNHPEAWLSDSSR